MPNERENLMEIARNMPDLPGIYLFKDKTGKILYIGKANSLRKRTLQYFDENRLEPAKREMIAKALSIDSIVVKNEAEALALEASLIQQHRPPYNIRLVDDSSYLYIKITSESYPKITLTRKVLPDSAWYRGPYPNAYAVRQTLKEVRKFFPWCSYPNPAERHNKPCFSYHIGLCPGICIGAISLEEYQKNFSRLKKFLDGETHEVVTSLKERMTFLSEQQNFEKAAVLRDKIKAIEKTMTPQDLVTPYDEDADIFGLATNGGHGSVALLQIRHGRIIGKQIFSLLLPSQDTEDDVLRQFLIQYYRSAVSDTKQILLPVEIPDAPEIGEMAHHGPVVVSYPKRGWKKELLETASANAKEALSRSETELQSPANLQKGLQDLVDNLSLSSLPKRIETYDISNIQGKLATASMVVFLNGKSAPSEYRKFKILTTGEPNDVGMMKEVLTRRFGKNNKWQLPDLIILDGGKGQLNGGASALKKLGVNIPIISLAKREEEVFTTYQTKSIILPRTSAGFYLLQRMRDEAHRFTISYHRLLRKKNMTKSILEEIPGVGTATRKKLLRAFGSLSAIRTTSPEELEKVLGSKKKAMLLSKFLKN